MGDRVACLINGRRVSDSTVDLNALPISAVERVEILSGSAAALHGVHPIAGSINIVLRRNHEGVEVQASAEQPTGEGSDIGQASALWGGALGEGRMVFAVDVFKRRQIFDADRGFSRARWSPGASFADTTGVSAGVSTVFIPVDGSTIAPPIGDCRGGAHTGVVTQPLGYPGTDCGFAYADVSWSWGTSRTAKPVYRPRWPARRRNGRPCRRPPGRLLGGAVVRLRVQAMIRSRRACSGRLDNVPIRSTNQENTTRCSLSKK